MPIINIHLCFILIYGTIERERRVKTKTPLKNLMLRCIKTMPLSYRIDSFYPISLINNQLTKTWYLVFMGGVVGNIRVSTNSTDVQLKPLKN